MEGTYGAEAGNMIIVYSGSEPYSMRGQPNIVKFLACLLSNRIWLWISQGVET